MDKKLEKILLQKYSFLRPKQNPQDLENNMEIMAKEMDEDTIKNLKNLEKDLGKPGVITDTIEKYRNKNNPDIYSKTPKVIWDLRLFGIECENGWFDLLDETFSKIQKHLDENQNLEFDIEQIKEKYGTLSIYYHGGDDFIERVIRDAEKKSSTICEVCGKPGKLCSRGFDIEYDKGKFYKVSNGKGWLKTLCFDDAKKLGYVCSKTEISEKEAYKLLKEMKQHYEKILNDEDSWNKDYIVEVKKKMNKINELLSKFN
jgi:hypothetical protein